MPEWLSEYIGDDYLIKKAEKNLKERLEMDIKNTRRDEGEIYEYDDTGKLRVKADMTKFALERLKKEKYSPQSKVDVSSGGKSLDEILDAIEKKKDGQTA